MQRAEPSVRRLRPGEASAALARDPGLLVWCLFVMLGPFYVLPSGLPQPGDMLIFLLVPLAALRWDGKLDRPTGAAFRSLVWFTFWVFVVNYGWAFVLWKWTRLKDFLIHPFFYLFNLALVFSGLVVARRGRERFLRLTVDIVYLSIFAQVAASFIYRTELYRGTVFFNSPNQLGYYALLAACLFAMTQRRLGVSRLKSGFAVMCCAYLAVFSASRAAAAGIAVLLFVLVFSNPRVIILASLAAAAMLTLGGPVAKAIDTAQERSESLSRHGTFAEERGYDRIWRFPEYLITGAGEGEYQRFAKPGEHGRELHSSIGSIVFGYGIMGVVLFLVFFLRVIRGAATRDTLMFVPALIYTVAHQGLRFTMFWVVLSVFVVLKQGPPVPEKTG